MAIKGMKTTLPSVPARLLRSQPAQSFSDVSLALENPTDAAGPIEAAEHHCALPNWAPAGNTAIAIDTVLNQKR